MAAAAAEQIDPPASSSAASRARTSTSFIPTTRRLVQNTPSCALHALRLLRLLAETGEDLVGSTQRHRQAKSFPADGAELLRGLHRHDLSFGNARSSGVVLRQTSSSAPWARRSSCRRLVKRAHRAAWRAPAAPASSWSTSTSTPLRGAPRGSAVPGGVGPMTLAMLLSNTLLPRRCRSGVNKNPTSIKQKPTRLRRVSSTSTLNCQFLAAPKDNSYA